MLSLATPNTVNHTIPPCHEVQEYMEKFLFQPHSAQGNMEVASIHYGILHKINECFQETKIFDNNGKMIQEYRVFEKL